MTLLSRLSATKAVQVTDANDTQRSVPFSGDLFGQLVTSSGQAVGIDSALKVVTVYACVRVLAETVASLPLLLYRRLPGGGKERFSDHPLYDVLHDQPNPDMTSFVFRETLMSHLTTWGNFYSEIAYDNNGRMSLWPLRPDRIEVYYDRAGRRQYDYLSPMGARKTLRPGSVFHVPGLSSNGLKGYAPITLHREAIGLYQAAQSFGTNFFRNNARPATVLSHPRNLSAPAIERLAVQMQELKGSTNAGKTVTLEEGMTITEIGIPPEDAQYIETRRFQMQEIARMFRVPPHMIGDLERATFCLPATEMVFAEDGPRSIADVQAGDRVWSRDDEGWRLATVEASACQGYDEIIEINTGLRTIRSNARHKIPVRRRVLRPWTGGRGQSVLVDGERHRWTWETVTVLAGEIVVGDQLLALDELPDSGKRSCPTRGEAQPEFMECLGLLIGDGFFGRSRGYDTTFGFSHGVADGHTDYYREAFSRSFHQQPGPGQSTATAVAIRAKERDANTTVFYSTAASAELIELGIHGTARTKRVPAWVFGMATDLKLAFLRGYLDADGTVDQAGRIRFVSVNRELLEDMRHLAMSVGLRPGHLRHSDIKSDFGTGKQYEHRLYRFLCSTRSANDRLGSHTPFYRERTGVGYRQRVVPIFPHEKRRREAPPGITYTAVTSIRKEPVLQPVYNISVAETHTMCASGIFTHQSNIEHQSIDFVVHTIRPWLVRIEQEIKSQLLFGEDVVPEFLVDGLLRGDALARASALNIQRNAGVINSDEWREVENRNPIPDGSGKVYWRPLNMGDGALEESSTEPIETSSNGFATLAIGETP